MTSPSKTVSPTPSRESHTRPHWLASAHLVRGFLVSSPGDLPNRVDQMVSQLRKRGWVVAVKHVDTAGWGTSPRAVDVYLLKDGSTLSQAVAAITTVGNGLNLTYRVAPNILKEAAISAGEKLKKDAGELLTDIHVTLKQNQALSAVGLVTGVIGAAALIYSRKDSD